MIKMVLTVKGKILMTVLTVVFLFALFILFYFPARQERYLIENYNAEVENFAKTVALGVKIALTEQNFEGVETAIDFVRNDQRLVYVSLIQSDSIPGPGGNGVKIEKTIFKSFPDDAQVDPDATSSELFIIKSAPFTSPIMNGEIQLSFTTEEIINSRNQIRITSLIASLIVFAIGLVIGYLLARNISKPVLALRDAANKVGEGDLTQSVKNISRDEIGELSIAFNKMVRDLSVEASLERVRTKAMAMEISSDLEITIASVLLELDHIGLASEYSGIGIIDGKSQRADFWTSSVLEGGNGKLFKGSISLSEHPFLTEIYNSWQKQQPFTYILRGEDYQRYYRLFENKNIQLAEEFVAETSSKAMQFCYTAMFANGAISIFRKKSLEDGNMQILQRFADVFHLAYTRYQDLRNSEINALKELKQASLSRVRGEIASMRTPKDLQRITPIIWKELTALGVPFIRCGVFIVDKSQKALQSFLSSPSGESLSVFILPYETHEIASKIFDHWSKGVSFIEHWNQDQFLNFMNLMIAEGRIKNQKSYLGEASAPTSLHLHFFPFNHGMMYVGSDKPLSAEDFQTVETLTESFAMAYARYEDFTQLEVANYKMELTLHELKSTQSQLIQSEKMASLGELTAGIAHEIQNPLNFVNNFSEVNKELLAELKEEIDNGNYSDVKVIADDVISNEEKIIHHGKRADAIVKGMLQHSRSSSGVKEPTDINALTDEYLRLAYHGLRAKDKSFNAGIKTEYDESIGNINLMQQDIGRVVLNLITNAFYAVNEKNKEHHTGYEPTVSVVTKRVGKKIQIKVIDNGNGIPKNILDKIYQPFFTTKPTGQGTGLGLSLSYDIVKAHNGEIKVETNEGVGSEFMVELPG